MQDDRRRRPRRRGRGGGARPVQPPARPVRGAQPPAPARTGRAQRPRRDRRRERGPDDLRPGTPCVILLDRREGEPDRTGAAATFEGFFDPETGEPRRSGQGIPRLRLSPTERVWGTEVWWRPDPQRTGLTPEDLEQIETSKRLLRGLLRDTRRRPLAPR